MTEENEEDSYLHTATFVEEEDHLSGSTGLPHSHNVTSQPPSSEIPTSMFNSRMRRNTFRSDSIYITAPCADAMADSGLYLIGVKDITQCHRCNKVQNNWIDGKNIRDPAHHEPWCPYNAEFHNIRNYKAFESGLKHTQNHEQDVPLCGAPNISNGIRTVFSMLSALVGGTTPALTSAPTHAHGGAPKEHKEELGAKRREEVGEERINQEKQNAGDSPNDVPADINSAKRKAYFAAQANLQSDSDTEEDIYSAPLDEGETKPKQPKQYY